MVQGQDSNCSLCQAAKCPGGLQKLQKTIVADGGNTFTHISQSRIHISRVHSKSPELD